MGQAGAMLTSKYERDEYLEIIISSASPYNLTPELIDSLRDIVDKGFHRSKAEDEDSSRTLEIEENCRLLGNQLRDTAINNDLPPTSPITNDVLDQVLYSLCPGLWPFC